MQIASALGGFSLGQADLLRRAMGKKKESILVAQRANFLEGTRKNNISDEIANKIFDLMVYLPATASINPTRQPMLTSPGRQPTSKPITGPNLWLRP